MHVLRIVLTLVIALQGPVAITGGSFRSAAAQRCECHSACRCEMGGRSCCARAPSSDTRCAMRATPCHGATSVVVASIVAGPYVKAASPVVRDDAAGPVVRMRPTHTAWHTADAPNPPPPRA
jgi:hypothetical protein